MNLLQLLFSSLLILMATMSIGQCELDILGPSCLNGKTTITTTDIDSPLDIKTNKLESYMQIFSGLGNMGYVGVGSGITDIDLGTGDSNPTGDVNLTIQGVPKLTVNKNGLVGIGTRNPGGKLEIKRSDSGQLLRLRPGVSNGNLITGDGDFRIGNFHNHLEMGVYIDGDNEGKSTIQADGPTLGDGELVLGVDNFDVMRLFMDPENGFSSTVEFSFNGIEMNMAMSDDGNDWQLRSRSSEVGIIVGSTPSDAIWSVGANRFMAASVYNYWSYSDKKIKENIRELPNSIDKINALEPVIYDLKKDHFYISDREKLESERVDQMGFIAQDLKTVFPSLVTYDQESDLHAVGYMGLIPVLTKAIQELSGKNEELEKQNKEMKYRLEKLEASVFGLTEK